MELTKAAWHGVFKTIGDQAENASLWWNDHLAKAPRHPWWWDDELAQWSAKAVEWLAEDLTRWTALKEWVDDLAATREREAFEAATAKSPLDTGSVSSSPPRRLPGDEESDHQLMAVMNYRAVDLATPWISDAIAMAESCIQVVLSRRASRQGLAVSRALHTVGRNLSERWAALAEWSYEPAKSPLSSGA